ncbi:MAG: hypothetical protein ABIN91_03165 [Mucilaginibacter sp.]|uniref:hypothetical protein n=1 Tax=Mucilaginibacter sp. TaxID=1882438 RepID=UPI003266FE05
MKSLKNRYLLILLLAIVAIGQAGCVKIFGLEPQKNYDYHPQTLDNNINVTARKFLEDRASGTGIANSATDTIFKYMKAGLDYAGIDLAEFEKADRTYLFMTNDAIRVSTVKTTGGITTTTISAGLWFDYPMVTSVNPTTGIPVTKPATKWSDYPKEDVKNYFLYLIGQGRYNFADLNETNKPIQSLLPANTALSKSSMLGYFANGRGFDQAGLFYLKILNNSDSAPIVHNNKTNDRSGGYVATNGIIHVFGASLAPGLPVL